MDKGYRRLEIYRLAHDLAVKIHEMTLGLPSFERFEEGSQIRRSSKSVSCNIVEGYALRKYRNEYLHFLYRSYGSSEETLEHLRFLYETHSLTNTNVFEELASEYRKLNGMIFNFIQVVERTSSPPAFLKEPLAHP